MNSRAILLWGGNVPWKDIKNKISILKRNGIQFVYLVSCGEPGEFETEPGIVRIHNSIKVASGVALSRAMNYIQSLNVKERYGFFLIYGDSYIDDRILARVNQLVTICDVQPIDMFMVMRLTDKAYSKKYITDFHGYVTHSRIAIRGNDSLGIFFLCNRVLQDIVHGGTGKVSEMIDSFCKENKKIYSIINGCC